MMQKGGLHLIYKGSIVDIKTNYAIVMTDKAEFYKVVKKDGVLLGNQIIFLEDDLYKEKNIKVTKIIRYAAVMMLLFISSLFLTRFLRLNKISYIPIATISVDINPSIELEINKDYKIINIVSKNKEGDFIADKHMIGTEIQEALYTMLLKAKSKNYITKEKNSVLIGICKINDDFSADFCSFENDLNNRLNSNSELEYVNIVLLQGDNQKLELSRHYDLTIGKYLLYLKVNSDGSDLKLEEAKKMTTQEMVIYYNQNRNRYHGSEPEEPAADEVVNPDNNINQNQNQYQYQNSEPLTDNNTEGGYQNNRPTINEQKNNNNSVNPGQLNTPEVNKIPIDNDKSILENNISPAQEQNENKDREISSPRESKNERGKFK
ncbi:MAG: anti-sigma factor protein [Sedimentibacter sp.]|jgi:hypothetical protein|nr:anti-sigma factor protein [Sedimentibacter sp.]